MTILAMETTAQRKEDVRDFVESEYPNENGEFKTNLVSRLEDSIKRGEQAIKEGNYMSDDEFKNKMDDFMSKKFSHSNWGSKP